MRGLAAAIVAGAAFLISGGVSLAACRAGNPGLQDYVCSGVVSNAGDGIDAISAAGNTSVTVRSGSVTGTAFGVYSSTTGFDTIGITAAGNVTGTSRAGISTKTDIGYSQIDIGATSIVTGAIGVQIITNGAYGILNNNGSIVGTGSMALSTSLGVGSESINNNGSITGLNGTALGAGTGIVTLNNNATGLVDGAVVGPITTTVNNFGAWANASGSSFGSLVSTGTLTLGKPGTIGTFTVNGDATFKAGSATTLNIAPDGTSDRILVGGDLTIAGGALTLHGNGTGFVRGTSYTLFTTAGVASGAFSSLTTDIPKFLPILASNGANITVSLWQYDFRDLALTRNQYAAASAIAQATAATLTPSGAALIIGLNSATTSQMQAGLTQIAGDGLTAAKSVALRQGSLFMEAIGEQQAFWRSRESVDPNGITIGPFVPAPASTGPDWYAGQIKPLPPRLPPAPADRTVRMWVSGFGGEQSTQGTSGDGSAAQKGRIGGGAVGVDAQFGRNLLLGVAGGYSVGSFSVSDRQTSGQNTGLHAAMYMGFTANGFYGSANVGYSAFNTSTRRGVGVAGLPSEQEAGAYDSSEFRVRFEAGKLVDLGIGSITAFTALQGASLTSKPYVETSVSTAGAGLLGLAFLSQTTRSVPVEIGFRAETRLRMGVATLAPWVQVALVHDFSVHRDDLEYLAVLPGVAQTVYGARDARDTLRLKGGAQLTFSPRAALFVSAEADLSKTQRVYTGKGGFRYGW